MTAWCAKSPDGVLMAGMVRGSAEPVWKILRFNTRHTKEALESIGWRVVPVVITEADELS